MLFNKVLGENEKCVFYFYLKTEGTFWPTQYIYLFEEMSKYCSRRLHHFTFPQCLKVPFALHCCQYSLFLIFLDYNNCVFEGVLHYGTNLHFHHDYWCLTSFHVLLTICMSCLEKSLIRSFVHFKNWVLCVSVDEFLDMFWITDS